MNLIITDIKRNLPEEIVMEVFWTASKEAETITGSTRVSFKGPVDDTFIVYNDLTQEVVKGWLDLDNIEGQLDTLIVSKTTSTLGLPW